MTMVSPIFPSVKAAHEASPMNGGMVQPSTAIFTSLRGAVALKTRSAALQVPLTPVICSMRFVSSAARAASGSVAAMASDFRNREIAQVVIICRGSIESSFRAKGEIVEEPHAVGLGPDTDRGGRLERGVLDLEKLFEVEDDT